ncbi:hypothetical protein HPB51_003005 [Rhipicephalus microplus]|uniref:Uncharacterized protein n=1 Tax=Rhipicephalus microplus TaxID=6941 RepID=A0A9J6DSW2_RHIMP|nr:hypothetical protein HPB51_003005 [Rhipicephalus microplus]
MLLSSPKDPYEDLFRTNCCSQKALEKTFPGQTSLCRPQRRTQTRVGSALRHCRASVRDDFRKPLKELGIIEQRGKRFVSRYIWVAFDVCAEAVRHASREYGEVKEIISDKWRDEDFEGVESTIRFLQLLLKEGVTMDHIPHQVRLGSGTALVVVPARAPLCLRSRNTGHIRRDCRVSRCAGCRVFEHEQVNCTRSYASAASRAANADHTELLMGEEEAERAAASETAVEASHAVATSEREMETPKQDTDENAVMGSPMQRRSTQTETRHKPS